MPENDKKKDFILEEQEEEECELEAKYAVKVGNKKRGFKRLKFKGEER